MGVTARILRVTLVIGILVFLSAGVLAVIGAYGLASQKVDTGDIVQLQIIEDGVEAHLRETRSWLAETGEIVARSRGDRTALESELATLAGPGSHFRRVIITDRQGRVVAAVPATTLTSVGTNPAFPSDGVASGEFRVESMEPPVLWLVGPVGAARTGLIAMCEVDTSFLRTALDRIGRDQGESAVIFDGDVPVARSSSLQGVLVSGVVWDKTGTGSGAVRMTLGVRGRVFGHYMELADVGGNRSWRAVVIQPVSTARWDTFRAVAPELFVLVIGGIVSIVAAWSVSVSLRRPLRALERAAHRAAEGSFVKLLEPPDDVDFARVAHAFNSVALRLNALQDLARLLAGASHLDEVLDAILTSVDHILGANHTVVYLAEEGGRWMIPARARGVDLEGCAALDSSREGWVSMALSGIEPIIVDGSPAELSADFSGLAGGERRAVVAPLIAAGERLGVVVAVLPDEHAVSDAEREMISTFTAQAAIAVKNSRIFQAERESRRTADSLRAIADDFARGGSLEQTIDRVAPLVADLVGAGDVRLAFVDRPSLGLPPSADAKTEAQIVATALELLKGDARKAVMVATGDDPRSDQLLAFSSATELLLVPVGLDTDHGAVLALPFVGRRATARDLGLAETVALEIALALDNVYLYNRAVARADNLETIFRISQAVGSSLEVRVVLNRVMDVVQKLLSADGVVLMIVDERKRLLKTAMARGNVAAGIVTHDFQPKEDLPGYVFASGEPITLRDLTTEMEGVAGEAARAGLRSMVLVPLLARGRSVGVLGVTARAARAFSDEDISVLRTFASQAALALDTATLYSHEHEVARILQESLLPEELPVVPGIESGSVYAPAGMDAEIGGDYYDLLRGPDGWVWFAIADVCGKGVAAATKTSMIKYSVRSFVAAGFAPSQVVAEVNALVAEEGEPGDIVTLLVGRFDRDREIVEWANGGHPPGLIRHVDGRIDSLAPTGPLLGAIADAVYDQGRLNVGTGDTLLMYTDGVTEARRGGEFFGQGRVADLLEREGSPEWLARTLLDQVRAFSEGGMRDDAAILVLRVVESQPENAEERR